MNPAENLQGCFSILCNIQRIHFWIRAYLCHLWFYSGVRNTKSGTSVMDQRPGSIEEGYCTISAETLSAPMYDHRQSKLIQAEHNRLLL